MTEAAAVEPKLQKDYPKVLFWRKNTYKSSHEVGQSDPKEEKVAGKQSDYKKYNFLEHSDGRAFTTGEIAGVLEVARRAFRGLDSSRDIPPPTTWAGHALDVHREVVFKALYKHAPDIALCDDDWKANQVAIILYSGYRQQHQWPTFWADHAKRQRIKEEPRGTTIATEDNDPGLGAVNKMHDENADPAQSTPTLSDSAQKRAAPASIDERRATKKPKIAGTVIIDNPM